MPISIAAIFHLASADVPVPGSIRGRDADRLLQPEPRQRRRRERSPATGITYDVIIVDPFHEYETSAQHLRKACTLLKPNGTIVVHDCNPEEEAFVTPHYRERSWCGLTYKAYLDILLESVRLQSCTVNTDDGCAIVRRRPLVSRLRHLAYRAAGTISHDSRRRLLQEWRRAGKDDVAAFRLLKVHAKSLLNLVTVEEFLAGERKGAPVLR